MIAVYPCTSKNAEIDQKKKIFQTPIFFLILLAMRIPAASPQNQTNSKSISFNNSNTGHEPISVLDLRASRSSATGKSDVSAAVNPQQKSLDQCEDLVPGNIDWDTIAKDLELYGDSHLLDQQLDPASVDFNLSDGSLAYGFSSFDDDCDYTGFDFIEDLIRVAGCVESNESQLARVILARLNQRLRSPTGKPLQRATFYIKEALQSVLSAGSTRSISRISSCSEVVQMIRAHSAFSGISPIPMFYHFTANQAILDSVMNWKSTPTKSPPPVQILDFDIGFGGQYASLMREISEKFKSAAVPFLRVTAVVPEEYSAVESRLVKENLSQFARDLQIRFEIEFVPFQTFDMLSFKAIDFVDGERIAVLISPAILRRLNGISGFISNLGRVSPSVVVLVDAENWTENSETASLREEFVNIREFYSVMLESLEAVSAMGGGDWVRRIEAILIRQKILTAVEAAVRKRRVGPTSWREEFWSAGLRAESLSKLADFQAEFLVGKAQVGGFHVAKRQAELVLCWHNRPLVATSAWRF